MTGHVVHVVRSDGFAGVERYIAGVAGTLHERGWTVEVIGGDRRRMRSVLPAAVTHHPGDTSTQVALGLTRIRQCDVVHAHMTAAEFVVAAMKPRLSAKMIVTRHFAARRGASVIGRCSRGFIVRRVDAQISISKFVADAIGEPSTVIHHGVASSADTAVERSRTVVVLQRLDPEKNTATALRAWAASSLSSDGWRLEIHGRGIERRGLEQRAAALGVEQSVTFEGFTDDPRAVLARAGILLATASGEPFGLTVVEAMAEATPVLAADSGAHRETLADRGLYFAPGDVEECAVQLRRVAGSVELRTALGDGLRARQRAEFSLAGHVDRLVTVYGS